uniref:Heat shock protein binding protein n=1 Tax=Arundo donax TaxID=35708 RepID=A0A0A9EKE6_ARUDO
MGPIGAGKRTLVIWITRVFDKDDDPFASDQVQAHGDKKSGASQEGVNTDKGKIMKVS